MDYTYDYLNERLGDFTTASFTRKDGESYLMWRSVQDKNIIILMRHMDGKFIYYNVYADGRFEEWGED